MLHFIQHLNASSFPERAVSQGKVPLKIKPSCHMKVLVGLQMCSHHRAAIWGSKAIGAEVCWKKSSDPHGATCLTSNRSKQAERIQQASLLLREIIFPLDKTMVY